MKTSIIILVLILNGFVNNQTLICNEGNTYDPFNAIYSSDLSLSPNSSNFFLTGVFIKLGVGPAATKYGNLGVLAFDLLLRSQSILFGYTTRGMIHDIFSVNPYTIHAGSLRYLYRDGRFVSIVGGSVGAVKHHEWTDGNFFEDKITHSDSHIAAIANIDLGLYAGPVGINLAVEPVFSNDTFVMFTLSFCLLVGK